MMPSILVINPNSTSAVTDAIRSAIDALGPSRYEIKYLTASPGSGAPASINSPTDADLSTRALLPHLTPAVLSQHAAFLVACYSAHPLVPYLRRTTNKPVLGILEASVSFALAETSASSSASHGDINAGNGTTSSAWAQFGIVSTGAAWALPLTLAVHDYLHGNGSPKEVGRFAGVTTTGLDANALHAAAADDVTWRLKDAVKRLLREQSEDGSVHPSAAGLVAMLEATANIINSATGLIRAFSSPAGEATVGQDPGRPMAEVVTGSGNSWRQSRVKAICLGCAGMAGLDSIVREACVEQLGRENGQRVVIVDGVSAGIVLLEGMLRVRGLELSS